MVVLLGSTHQTTNDDVVVRSDLTLMSVTDAGSTIMHKLVIINSQQCDYQWEYMK